MGKKMCRKEIYQKVVSYIQAQLPVDAAKIQESTNLTDDLNADSANLMMLIMDLEGEFNLTVEDDVLAGIKTVGDIVDYLEAHI